MAMHSKLAWRNIWRNKRRTFITLSSVSFAVLIACVMQSMQLGSYGSMIDNAVRFYMGYAQIHKQGYWDEQSINNGFVYNDTIEEVIQSVENIETAVPRLETFALASHGKQVKGALVIGIDPQKEDKLTSVVSKIKQGSHLSADGKQVLVSQGLAEYLEMGVNDTLVLIGQGYHGVNAAGKYPVKGIVKFPSPDLNNQLVYMPLKEAQWLYGADSIITSLALVVHDADAVPGVVRKLKRQLDPEQYEVMDWKELMPELVQGIELDYAGGLIMLYILYAIIGFGIFGTLLMMTMERRYEFGILVSIGMKKIRLQVVVIMELILLVFLGLISGILLSIPIILYLYYNPIYLTGDYAKLMESFGMEPIVPFSLDPSIFYSQALVVLIITIIVSLYPIWAIYRLKPVEAMRG